MASRTGYETHYLNTQTSDVYFVCLSDDRQSEEQIPAHKLLLASKSPVFMAMFYGTLPETGNVKLPSVTAGTFKVFLQMFYLSEANLTMETVRDVIDLANQYQMIEGLVACGTFMIPNITTENFIATYELALLYDMTELKLCCETNASAFLTEENIYNCNQNELKHILQIKQLYAEYDLAEICVKWAKFACEQKGIDATMVENIQNELSECFRLLDFASMSTQKIHDTLAKCDVFFEKSTLKSIIGVLKMRGPPLDINEITYVAIENHRIKRIIEPIETSTLISTRTMTLKAVGFSPIYWENLAQEGQIKYGRLVIMKEKLPNESEHSVLLSESFSVQPIIYQPNTIKQVHVHRLESSLIIEPNRTHLLQIQLSLQNKGEIYSRSFILDGQTTTFNRRSDSPTEIFQKSALSHPWDSVLNT